METEEGLTFPVLYGVDVHEIRDNFGLYIEKGVETHLQPAQFILDPGGLVRLASYSSGPVGRLSASDAPDAVKGAR